MTNDISVSANLEEVVPCIALSKNDSYVMSASGGKVSLFNMMTFKVNYPLYQRFSAILLTAHYNPCISLNYTWKANQERCCVGWSLSYRSVLVYASAVIGV
jgi:hypothetical protein